ncbi:MAG: SDR family oxidoreductase [Anaerolineales bacterium]|nr:SDR family oxidoreductase [Anaerolineales bacterium]
MYQQMFRLDGRTGFVTGAARGIGLCTAEALAEAGARVLISDVNPATLAEGEAYLKQKGYDVATMVLDVTDSAACDRAAEEANRLYGPVDILIANAGIARPDTPGEEMPDETWLKVLDVNLNGIFWSCRAFARPMLARGRGAIVTIGSMSGVISNKPQRQVPYNASKAAVHHMTRSLAGEWAERGVRINCVAPTYVNTLMSNITAQDPYYFGPWMENTPMKRMVEPEEIAAVNLFLASDASSGMTGTIVLVDAGYTIW